MQKVLGLSSLLAVAALGNAGTLNSTLSADNTYHLYLSQNDSTLGTLIGSGSDWTNANTFTGTSLVSGQDYFLHVVAENSGTFSSGNPAALIGHFSLNGTDHKFSNGTTSLNTDSANWLVNNVGFGSAMVSATEFAPNGGGIWQSALGHSIAGVGNAKWIWSADGGANPTAYFSSKIQAVPEPATMAAMAIGGLGMLRRRRSARKA